MRIIIHRGSRVERVIDADTPELRAAYALSMQSMRPCDCESCRRASRDDDELSPEQNRQRLEKMGFSGEKLDRMLASQRQNRQGQKDAEFTGITYKRYGMGWRIIQGTGTRGGEWLVVGPGERKVYNNKADAEMHVEMSLGE